MDKELDALLDGYAKQNLKGKGNYLPPGFSGIVVFKPLKWNPAGFKGKSAIFEYTLETSNLESHPKGSSASFVIKVDATSQYASTDIKNVMMAIDGIDPATVRAAEVDPKPHDEAMAAFKEAIKDGKLIEGEKAFLQTVPYTTKATETKKAQVIALHKWAPASAATATTALAA